MLTKEDFQSALPKRLKGLINDPMVDQLNTVLSSDVEAQERYRENLISYTSVLKEGKFRLSNYVDAVRFITFRMMGEDVLSSWGKTFPERYKHHVSRGIPTKDLHSYASAYNRTKLVSSIIEQTLVPVHILNADYFQKALNVQVEIMMDTNVSPKVRSDAADSVMNRTKAPESKKLELEVSTQNDGVIADLNRAMNSLAEQQKMMIQEGLGNAKQLAESKLIMGEVIEDESN